MNGIRQKEFGISQKEVHCICVLLVYRIPQFDNSQGEVYFIYVQLVNWLNPSKGVWHLSEGGMLYLCFTCKQNPSKGVLTSPRRSGTLYICVTCKLIESLRRRYTVFMFNLSIESLKRSLASVARSGNEVHFIYG